MFKSIITVTLLLQSLLRTECLFNGDSCVADNQSGSCLPLLECQSVVDEIKGAVRPLPLYIRQKLQKLTCGFESQEPLVCCVSSTHKDSINMMGSDDNVEPFTRRPLENKSGPISVEFHPNLSLLPLQCGNIESDRIILGGNSTELYEMPWMVLLSYDSVRGNKLSCGGTLINEWYVLTAAHCVAFVGRSLRLNGVIIGEHDVRQDPDCEISDHGIKYCAPSVKNVTIDSVVAHPGYTPQSRIDDIALIRLSEKADFKLSSMKPLCLPLTSALQTESLAGEYGTVAGWGVTEDGLQSPTLLRVNLPIITRKDCQAAYKGIPQIKDTLLCAGGEKDKDSCGGDSGGPLMFPGKLGPNGVKYIQRGIISFGPKRCGIGGFPGVYTNVAYYMDWILDNIHS